MVMNMKRFKKMAVVASLAYECVQVAYLKAAYNKYPIASKDGQVFQAVVQTTAVKKRTRVVTVALHCVLTAQDCQELAELVHKAHLLCLLARVGVIDKACNGPLIQASVLCFTTRLAVEETFRNWTLKTCLVL